MSGAFDQRSDYVTDPGATVSSDWPKPAVGRGSIAPSWWRRWLLSKDCEAVWVRPALLGLLAFTAVLYLWALGRSGWANAYYAAAVQAGTKSWKAFFFGSFDSSNFLTVDKTPASLWVMVLSARVFGLNSWSLLVPQALMGVATVGFPHAAVRRWWGPAGGLLAGAVVALTPVAALMFRYNNPDALLTLVLVVAAYAVLRAIEDGRTRWLVLAGGLVGFGYLAKMLEAFMVLPVFALAYLVAGPPNWGRRVGQSLLALAVVVVSAGWWVVVVQLWPASSRPLIGGSTTDNILQLTFGYNGLGRLSGNEVGAVGRVGAASSWGATGLLRLFGTEMGGEISWLLPATLVVLVVGVVIAIVAWRAREETPSTGRMLRGGLLVWGGWLLLTGFVFSYAAGIIHPYYNVVLAPPIGALLGIVLPLLWRRGRASGGPGVAARAVLGLITAGTVAWAYVLLSRTPDWLPWLRVALIAAGGVAAAALMVGAGALSGAGWRRAVVVGIAALSLAAGLGGTAAYALATAGTPHTGPIPSSGPSGFAEFGVGSPGLGAPWRHGRPPAGRGLPARPSRGSIGGGFPAGLPSAPGLPAPGNLPGNVPRSFVGGPGVFAEGTISSELANLVRQDADQYRWAAAMTSADNAAPIQLAAGAPVMAIGGFNGTDQLYSLGRFIDAVRARQIHYYIAGGGFAGSPNVGVAAQIASWVRTHYTTMSRGGAKVYDLSVPPRG